MQNSFLKLAGLMAVAFTLASAPLSAQTTTAETQSSANNTANQVSASGAVAINNFPAAPSRVESVQSGTARLETAPSLGGLAVGGGHPCAWTPGSGQISIIGGGLGGSGMTIDEACMLAVMGSATGSVQMHNAALYMIAARDPDACKAMYMAGLVTDCVTKEGKSRFRSAPTVSTSGKAAAPVKVGYTKCQKAAGNKVVIRYAPNANKALARSQCLTTLGY